MKRKRQLLLRDAITADAGLTGDGPITLESFIKNVLDCSRTLGEPYSAHSFVCGFSEGPLRDKFAASFQSPPSCAGHDDCGPSQEASHNTGSARLCLRLVMAGSLWQRQSEGLPVRCDDEIASRRSATDKLLALTHRFDSSQ